MAQDVPSITSKRYMTYICEYEDNTTGFLRTSFAFVDGEHAVWYGQIDNVRRHDMTIEDMRRVMHRLPDDILYPEVISGLTILPDADAVKKCYIKGPELFALEDPEMNSKLPKLLIKEAQILELLKPHGHKDLAKYHGCVSKRGRIVGIALDRHSILLPYRLKQDPRDLDIAACMDGLRAGVEHLHSLGFAHNNLKPSTIALDAADQPVILDFEACRRFGEPLLNGRRRRWNDEDCRASDRHHDISALLEIESWLLRQRPPREEETQEPPTMIRPLESCIKKLVAYLLGQH